MTDDKKVQELTEELAAIEHDRWSSWQRFMHGKCFKHLDGSLTIPADLVEKWNRQMNTSYADLTEKEKESDREQVYRYLPLVESFIAKHSIPSNRAN